MDKPTFKQFLLNEVYYSRSTDTYTDYIRLGVYDPEMNHNDAEVELKVDYKTEKADRSVGYPGGIQLVNVSIAKPVTFMGHNIPPGPFPEALLQYADMKDMRQLQQYILDRIETPTDEFDG